jgi:hypothetical protein
MAKTKKKKRKKLKKYQIEIDLLDAKSIRKGIKQLRECKIAKPWEETVGSPPGYRRYGILGKHPLAIVDPHLDGFVPLTLERRKYDMWGWKTYIRFIGGGGGTSWGGICKTAEEAKAAADEWLKANSYTLLEE